MMTLRSMMAAAVITGAGLFGWGMAPALAEPGPDIVLARDRDDGSRIYRYRDHDRQRYDRGDRYGRDRNRYEGRRYRDRFYDRRGDRQDRNARRFFRDEDRYFDNRRDRFVFRFGR